MKIIVASKNPVKVNATRRAFEQMFPAENMFEVEGVSVSSGVRDQPLTFDETLLGARTRVDNAQAIYPDADYWVGLEGGVDLHGGDMAVSGWVVARDRSGREGKSMTNTIYLPPKVAELVAEEWSSVKRMMSCLARQTRSSLTEQWVYSLATY